MGFELAQQLQPDLVVSDVMMPVMSGKEMCYKIKNSLELAYIPVVLLTAQSSIDYTIEGYMFGADDYITKPFNVKLLLARCNNLLRNRRLLLKKLTRTEAMIPQEAGGFTAADQKSRIGWALLLHVISAVVSSLFMELLLCLIEKILPGRILKQKRIFRNKTSPTKSAVSFVRNGAQIVCKTICAPLYDPMVRYLSCRFHSFALF